MPLQPKLDLETVNSDLEKKSPEDILAWVHETFGNKVALQTSMQKTASTLTAMISEMKFAFDVVFVDTQYHFPETLETRDRLAEKYGIKIITLYPERTPEEQKADHGRELYLADGDYQVCCQLRKEIPWIRGVTGKYNAILGGLMRSEGGKRSEIPIVSVDDRIRAYKIYPLANWTVEEVDRFNDEHGVPVHPLHAQGYPSIGCATCTTPVAPGEDPRAGRWRHIIRQKNEDGSGEEAPTKLYCGINQGENI